MEHTVSLKLNHVFRRLYGRGKSAVNPCLAVYCRKNNLGYSRLGLTVGVKLGKAVVRNRTRRRIKEAYRCLLYTSPSPRDGLLSRMPSSA